MLHTATCMAFWISTESYIIFQCWKTLQYTSELLNVHKMNYDFICFQIVFIEDVSKLEELRQREGFTEKDVIGLTEW